MPTSINSSQLHAIDSGALGSILGNASNSKQFKEVKFEDLANTLAYVAALYCDKLATRLNQADATSSGALADKTIPLTVEYRGGLYTVEIQTLNYAKFIDAGVDGWGGPGKGGLFKFKTKGVDPNGDMVKSIKQWLIKEGSMSKIKQKITVSYKESRRAKITDTTTKAAISTAYMIKRMGIAPTHYWQQATGDITEIIKKEFAAALKVDIVNNIML